MRADGSPRGEWQTGQVVPRRGPDRTILDSLSPGGGIAPGAAGTRGPLPFRLAGGDRCPTPSSTDADFPTSFRRRILRGDAPAGWSSTPGGDRRSRDTPEHPRRRRLAAPRSPEPGLNRAERAPFAHARIRNCTRRGPNAARADPSQTTSRPIDTTSRTPDAHTRSLGPIGEGIVTDSDHEAGIVRSLAIDRGAIREAAGGHDASCCDRDTRARRPQQAAPQSRRGRGRCGGPMCPTFHSPLRYWR